MIHHQQKPYISQKQISHLILDFDGTLTINDTISQLAECAYRLKGEPFTSADDSRYQVSIPRESQPQRRTLPPWSFFENAYLHDYSENVNLYPVPALSRTSLVDEFEYQRSFYPVEGASVDRIETHGVFAGLSLCDVAGAATAVDVRCGFWSDVAKPLLEGGSAVDVLSINWSRTWIQSTLLAQARREACDSDADASVFLERIGIYSNDLEVKQTTDKCEENRTTGIISCSTPAFAPDKVRILTGWEKLHTMRYLATEREKKVGSATITGLTVYVGDSATDLFCMLNANVGIVIGDGIDKVCRQLGIPLVYGLDDVEVAAITTLTSEADFFGLLNKNPIHKLYKISDLPTLGDWIKQMPFPKITPISDDGVTSPLK